MFIYLRLFSQGNGNLIDVSLPASSIAAYTAILASIPAVSG